MWFGVVNAYILICDDGLEEILGLSVVSFGAGADFGVTGADSRRSFSSSCVLVCGSVGGVLSSVKFRNSSEVLYGSVVRDLRGRTDVGVQGSGYITVPRVNAVGGG